MLCFPHLSKLYIFWHIFSLNIGMWKTGSSLWRINILNTKRSIICKALCHKHVITLIRATCRGVRLNIFFLSFFFPTRPFFFFFINRRIHLCMRMTGGLCYLETFKAELSLVILCFTSQEGLLTLKLALLNSCVCPPLMCTCINKWCCWRHGQFLLAFIHISPLWPCKSNHPQDRNIFISLALVPESYKK